MKQNPNNLPKYSKAFIIKRNKKQRNKPEDIRRKTSDKSKIWAILQDKQSKSMV